MQNLIRLGDSGLNGFDRSILNTLNGRGRAGSEKIGAEACLLASAVSRRIHPSDELGVISGYRAIVAGEYSMLLAPVANMATTSVCISARPLVSHRSAVVSPGLLCLRSEPRLVHLESDTTKE